MNPQSLQPGTRIGVFEIDALLGAGGMGEVYRARDTRLDRDVAIKFLTAPVGDETARRRFQQEARTASSLNHPNIAMVLEAGEFNDRQYLVTEYVDGGTLADWARATKPSWKTAIDLLTGVADGLAAAHDAGILHRDIKPENILITKRGTAKLVDFGIAKFIHASRTASLTKTVDVGTSPGVIVGTVAYMSPEQASGSAIDTRSDLFSFGVVLYELLAGRRPYEGKTDLEQMYARVHGSSPRLGDIGRGVPEPLRLLVEKLLEKDPADRYQSAHEVVVDLRRMLRDDALAPLDAAQSSRSRTRMLSFAALAALVIVAAGVWALNRPWSRVTQTSDVTATPPMEQITAFSDFAVQPAFSPDGRMVTFIRGPASFTTTGQVYVKLLPNGDPVQLTNDSLLKMMPEFTPDGSRVVYTVNTDATNSWDTWIVPVIGGAPKLWLPNASGLQWIGPQRLLFSEIKTGIHMALVTATESRTESRDVYVPKSIRGMVHRSYASPDRSQAIVAEMDDGGMLPCRLVPLDSGSMGRIVGPPRGRCTHAAWSPDGQWMYFSSNASGTFQLWRQRYPDGALQQLTFPPTEAEGIAIAPDGGSIVTSIGLAQHTVWVSDERGERQISSEGDAILPAWGDGFPTSVFSPDGQKLYYLVAKSDQHEGRGFGHGELWVADRLQRTNEPLLPGLSITSYDISADGETVAFAANEANGMSGIWIARLDRRTPPRKLPPAEALGPVFGRAGEIYYRGWDRGIAYLYALDIATGESRKFTTEPAVNSPIVSPDGQWILSLVSNEGKNSSTLLKAFPKAGGKPLTVCVRCYPKWTRDQRFLFFSFLPGNDVERGSTFVFRLAAGHAFPPWPTDGVKSESDLPESSRVRVIARPGVFPGLTPETYAFRTDMVRRNLYRIHLPR